MGQAQFGSIAKIPAGYEIPRLNPCREIGAHFRAKGQVIHVAGRVLNQRGEPLRGAQVELWQANAAGRYSHPSDPNPASQNKRAGIQVNM